MRYLFTHLCIYSSIYLCNTATFRLYLNPHQSGLFSQLIQLLCVMCKLLLVVLWSHRFLWFLQLLRTTLASFGSLFWFYSPKFTLFWFPLTSLINSDSGNSRQLVSEKRSDKPFLHAQHQTAGRTKNSSKLVNRVEHLESPQWILDFDTRDKKKGLKVVRLNTK